MPYKRHIVTGVFTTAHGVTRGLAMLRDARLGSATVYSPLQLREIEAEMSRPEGLISFFALLGSLIGATAGFVLTVGSSVELSIVTGGQPIISLPPFLVVIFELTILFGVLGTILGMFFSIRQGTTEGGSYDPRFSIDRFGLRIDCDDDRVGTARELLVKAGAEQVRDEKY